MLKRLCSKFRPSIGRIPSRPWPNRRKLDARYRTVSTMASDADAEVALLEALQGVHVAPLAEGAGDLGLIKKVQVSDSAKVSRITIYEPSAAYPHRTSLARELAAAAAAHGVHNCGNSLELDFVPPPPSPAKYTGLTRLADGLQSVSNVVAVSSAKGGVGKSTVAVNLAFAMRRMGARVGLLDADVYGPSLPYMISPENTDVVRKENGRMSTVDYAGIRCMSYGWVARRDASGERTGGVMRGPLVSTVVQQLASLTDWGPLDYLIVDMPPGTGDIQITLGQKLALAGAVVVTTPHSLSRADAAKGITLFESMRVPVLALVENMSYFVGDGGKVYRPLGRGHTDELVRRFGIGRRIRLPMHQAVAGSCDGGMGGESTDGGAKAASRREPWEDFAARGDPEPLVLWGAAGEGDGYAAAALPQPGGAIRAVFPGQNSAAGSTPLWEDPCGPETLGRASDALFGGTQGEQAGNTDGTNRLGNNPARPFYELAAAVSDACSLKRFGGAQATTSVSWAEGRGDWDWLFPGAAAGGPGGAKGALVVRYFRRTGAEEFLLPASLVRAASRAADAEQDRRDRGADGADATVGSAGAGANGATQDVPSWSGLVQEAARHVEVAPLKVEPQGLYAVQIEWSDGHSSSIYSYEMLQKLGRAVSVHRPKTAE